MRLTIDVDGRCNLLNILKRIKDIFGKGIIDKIFISASGNGYHIICYGLKLFNKDVFFYRKIIGDDIWRIRIDEYKFKNSKSGLQVLWTTKKGKRVKKLYDREKKFNKLPRLYRCYV